MHIFKILIDFCHVFSLKKSFHVSLKTVDDGSDNGDDDDDDDTANQLSLSS